jgi:hypothetical protein
MSYTGVDEPTLPLLHGRQIALATRDTSLDLPPVGAFNWHYIQCVLKKFATPDYKSIKHIRYFVLPFRTRDDDESDRDFDDERNIADPPYPSYHFELAQWRAFQRLEAVERNHAIEEWKSGVSVS